MSGLRCLCVVMICCAHAASRLAADPPNLLTAPVVEADNPFEAALRDENAPAQHSTYRFLGRPSTDPSRPSVVFADDETMDAARRDGEDSEGRALWGHARIEQTQYPLDVPPVALAPDDDEWVAPILRPPQTNLSQHEPWIAATGWTTDFTSVVGSDDDLGISTLTVGTTIESPRFKGFSIRPHFGMHLIAGPQSTDLPGQLYDVSIEARMYFPVGDNWLIETAVSPGMYSDFQNTSSDAIRIVGRGMGYYKWSDALRLVVGVIYLDREDIALLPAGGVIWTPNPDWRYEIMLPQPRIAHRYWFDDQHERWLYAAGEFGGGSWAIERSNGTPDIATYRDYRLLFGVEFQYETGPSWRIEGGYVFGRELEYQSDVGTYSPDGTPVVRAALSF